MRLGTQNGLLVIRLSTIGTAPEWTAYGRMGEEANE
jgi:hypothetical protein